MAGRPTKLEPQRAEIILKAVAGGMPKNMACEMAGIAAGTLCVWQNKGEAGIEPYAEFCEALKKAACDYDYSVVGTIREHSLSSWQAGAWLLERRHPEIWAKREYVHKEEPKENATKSLAERKAELESELEAIKMLEADEAVS